MLSVDELADVLETSKPSDADGGTAAPKSLQIKEMDRKADTWSSLFRNTQIDLEICIVTLNLQKIQIIILSLMMKTPLLLYKTGVMRSWAILLETLLPFMK